MEIDTQGSECDVVFRPLHCKLNAQARSDGSAMLTQGNTSVTVTVNGPVEVKLHNLSIEKAHIEVYYRPKSGLPTIEDKLREQILRDSCQHAILSILYPRSSITLQDYEMENAGGLIACAVNAACLALMNSGLSMKALIAGVHCVVDENKELVLDPEQSVCEKASASFTFVFENIDRKIVSAHTTGKYSYGQYNDAVTLCKEASESIFKFYREAVTKFVIRSPTTTAQEAAS